jgi:hypothetical protein
MTEISKGARRLFEVEIMNEHDESTGNSRSGNSSPGGVSPATLESCLDSLEQGLDLPGYDSDAVISEINALISKLGGETPVAGL